MGSGVGSAVGSGGSVGVGPGVSVVENAQALRRLENTITDIKIRL
jgi:hypothetical protein